MNRAVLSVLLLAVTLVVPAGAPADIAAVARCQKKIANAGADFSKRVISTTLKCVNEVTECQVQCEEGLFGPPCENNPPPCCDPDDRTSNATFGACMDDADAFCAVQNDKIVGYELTKQNKITAACDDLTQDELCGAQTEGLNFALLNAGCIALDPGYVCNLPNLISCVGGPLERALVDQISATLNPRAGDAIAALNLHAAFPDIPIARKVKEDLPAGKVDVWALTGQAGDEVVVRVKTRDDTMTGSSTLEPTLTLLAADQTTPLPDSGVNTVPCSVPNTCGTGCPELKRRLPFNGTVYVAIKASQTNGCSGGRYRLVVVTPSGAVPVLVADDVSP